MQELDLCKTTSAYQKMHASWAAGRLFHANLIVGTDAVLSRALALIMAAEVVSSGAENEQNSTQKVFKHIHPDVLEFGLEKAVDVAAAKDIIDKVQISPYEGDNKVIIIHGFDMCGPAPMNKLLKTLEEPPKGTYFFLLVENENRLLQTITSRTQKYYVPLLSDQQIMEYVKQNYPSFDAEKMAGLAGGSIKNVQDLSGKDAASKIYDVVMDTFLNYNKTSQFGEFAKKMESVKPYLKEVLNIFASISSKAIRLRIGKASITNNITNITDAGKVASSWPFAALVLVVEATVKAQEMLDKKTTEQNVIDQFLFRILEVKIKCRR